MPDLKDIGSDLPAAVWARERAADLRSYLASLRNLWDLRDGRRPFLEFRRPDMIDLLYRWRFTIAHTDEIRRLESIPHGDYIKEL